MAFNYDGTKIVENEAPLVIGGDEDGDIQPFDFTLGVHTLTATAYAEAKAGGTKGASVPIVLDVRP